MEPRRVSSAIVALCVVGFLLLRTAAFLFTQASDFTVYQRYSDAIRQTSLAQHYRDTDVEYPPLGVVLSLPVSYLADELPEGAGRLTVWRSSVVAGLPESRYEVALSLVLIAVDLACLVLVYLVARRAYPLESRLARAARLGLYVAATGTATLILYDRLDLGVGLFALLALWAFARGWSVAAYALITAGTAYKLVPVLLLPMFVLATAAARSAPRATPRRFLLAVVKEALVAGAILAVYPVLSYLLWGERSFAFLKFHSARGLQLEAPATWFVFLLDPDTRVGFFFNSMTLTGALADRVAVASTFAVALAAGLSVLVGARGFWQMAKAAEPPPRNALVTHLATASLLIWVGFILFNKVGSPQYLLWLAVLVPLLPLRGLGRWCIAVLLAAMVVTTVIYPCLYFEVAGDGATDVTTSTGPSPLGLILLIAKSLSLAVAFLVPAAMMWRRVPVDSPPPEVR